MGCCCCGGLYLASGTRLTYQCTLAFNGWLNCKDLVVEMNNQVTTLLQNSDNLVVESVNYTSPAILTPGSLVTVTLGVRTTIDHGGQGTNADDDVRQIIDHAFYVINGSLPTSSAILAYTPANPLTGAPITQSTVTTGAPEQKGCGKPSGCQKPGPLDNLQLPSLTPLAWGGLIGLIGLGALFVFLKAA